MANVTRLRSSASTISPLCPAALPLRLFLPLPPLRLLWLRLRRPPLWLRRRLRWLLPLLLPLPLPQLLVLLT